MTKRTTGYCVVDRDARYYATDDRGDVVWVTGAMRGMRDVMSETQATQVVESYAPSVRARRKLRVVTE